MFAAHFYFFEHEKSHEKSIIMSSASCFFTGRKSSPFSATWEMLRYKKKNQKNFYPVFVDFFLFQFFDFIFQRRKPQTKQQKKEGNLDDLKQELDIDHHKISIQELYQRFSTNGETVSNDF